MREGATLTPIGPYRALSRTAAVIADSDGAAGAQDRGGGELGRPGEGGHRHHDRARATPMPAARARTPKETPNPSDGDGERRDGAHAVAVVSLAVARLGHGRCSSLGQVGHASMRSLPSFAGDLAACRWPPLPSARARIQITTTAHGLTPERVRHALNGLPPADGYALHVKPLRYRERPHLSAWTDFDERTITLQVPEPFFPFGEIVPYAAKRRPSAARAACASSSGSPRASRSARPARSCGSSTATSGCTGTYGSVLGQEVGRGDSMRPLRACATTATVTTRR